MSAAALTRSGGGESMRSVCTRRFGLKSVPALPLEAGFQGGAAPLGVLWRGAAKKRFAMGMSLGNGQLIHVRQSAIRIRLPIPFGAWCLCVLTMRPTIRIGSKSAVREIPPN